MMRLVMEAVMIIAIVSCLFFMMKVTAKENQLDKLPPDAENPDPEK